MTLNKVCSGCGEKLTTKNVKRVGFQEGPIFDLLLGNCLKCKSTIALARRAKRAKVIRLITKGYLFKSR